jgi:hypothetical protein
LNAPASNQQIVARIRLRVETGQYATPRHVREIRLDELQQNQKRAALAEMALRVGLVSNHDL